MVGARNYCVHIRDLVVRKVTLEKDSNNVGKQNRKIVSEN